MKRILSLLLAVAMLVSGLPVQAFATADTTAPAETVAVETTAAEETTVPEETDPSVPETTEETSTEPSVPETTEVSVVETTEAEETMGVLVDTMELNAPILLSADMDQWAGVDTDALSNTITVAPGQLLPETCEIAESEIYGYVVGYPLAKGHVLSISDSSFVFSVRKLVDGNYSTLLKEATADSFTATEDMTVAMLVRKPDKSAVTAEELASVVIHDSQFGMVGVEGSVKRFTVEAETIDGGTAATRAAIFLPDSYSDGGSATKLIIMTNGGSAYLTESSWQGNTEANRDLVETYLQNGYAVLVNDNTAGKIVNNANEMVPDLGCLQQLSGLMKSYEHVYNALNLERKFSIHARSQGTFVGIRMMREYPELVKCALITGPNVSAAHRWTVITNRDHTANRFGFADQTGMTFEADKFVGNDIYTDMADDNYSLPPTFWMESSDDVCPDSNKSIYEVVERLRELDCTAEYQKFSSLTHSEVCRLTSEESKTAALAFLKAHQTESQPSEPEQTNVFAGKVISIMGDSISTFDGYIPTADGFNLEHLARYPQDDLLTDVNETWWMQVITALDAKLGINDSWRGATLSGGAPVTTGTTGENAAMSNPVRIQNLGANGTPDIILLYGGTNDLAHVSKVGSFDAATAPDTVDLTTAKWDNLADGFVHTILRMRHYYPNAQIVALLPAVTASYYSDAKLAEGNAVMAQICEHYGVPYTDLRDCGITTADLPDGTHPDAAGMDYITEAVLDVLLSQCEVEAGENKVYSVSHKLTGAKASLSYYKGISAGKAFEETVTGDDLTVTVSMGGQDITSSAYADGKISIASVTGDLVITAKAVFSLGEKLQQLPEEVCAGTNLWTKLTHDKEYYTASGWGVHSSGKVYSVTFPVSAGDRIYANSFRKGGENGTTTNGIRVTYFGAEGMLKSLTPTEVYNEYTKNGWLTVPEGANAVNVPMWTKDDSNELFLLNAEHSYENGKCTVCGEKLEASETLSLRYDDHYDIAGKTVEIVDAGKPTSYQVGYGVAEGTLDTAVVTVEGDHLVATGIGTAIVMIDGTLYEVTVTAAPISLLLLIGQSNMRGSEGNADQSIVCPDGMVYSTYGDDRGATNTAFTVDNATQFAPSALTGEYSKINVEGTTDCISGYPLDSLTEDGDGRMGPDSGFAYEWVKQTGEKVWVVNAAHGGTSITTWQDGGDNYEEAVKLFSACQETLRKEIEAGHFTLSHMGYFWCQGCTDYSKTAEWYVNKYLAMHGNLKSELAFDHDSDSATADKTFEFGGIIPVRAGHDYYKGYRDGVYTDTTTAKYYESFQDLRFNGPRVAQYWMINNPELTDIWGVCNIGEDWVTMPDGTDGVAEYFNAHYENGTVDYTTQVKQSASWYTPTTPAAVHDSIHYNQIGYNEIGRESVRNALILLGEMEAPAVETEVKLLSWDGYTEVTEVPASTTGNSETLVVPVVYPVWKSKEVTASVTEGLTYEYYDVLAKSGDVTGKLTVNGESVSVVKGQPGLLYADHLSQLPENLCSGLNLWNVLDRDEEYYASGTHWGTHSSGEVRSVTIPVQPGDQIFATSFGKAGENGHDSSNGIRTTFFGEYSIVKTMSPAEVYSEFSQNGYLTAPEGATAINVAMWNGEDTNELYILNAEHSYENGKCVGCGEKNPEEIDFTGKTVSILSHSMSTYEGVSNDTNANSTIGNNDVYYTEGRHGVYREDTWWQQAIDALDMQLLVNNSWSGSCIFMPRKGAASVGYGDRAVNLHNDHTGEEPDVIWVYLGCNDFAYYQDSFGTGDAVDYSALIEDTGNGTFRYAEPKTTCEAYAIMLHKIRNRYPEAEIYCITSTARRDPDYTGDSYADAGQPTEFMAQLHKVAGHFGFPVVDLEDCIPKEAEIFDQYIADKRAHANALGMNRIAEAVVSTMLGQKTDIHRVKWTGEAYWVQQGEVTWKDSVLTGETITTTFQPEDGYEITSITVTMGGEDISQWAVSGNTVTIDSVTGDVEVTIETAVKTRAPLNFHWYLNWNDLDATQDVNNTRNELTRLGGTTENGVFSDTYYKMETPVLLRHDMAWVVAWECGGDWSGLLLSAEDASNIAGNTYLFRTYNDTKLLAFGERRDGKSHNYGIALADYGINTEEYHHYRLENRWDYEKETNMVYLIVDGVELGAMNNYFIGGTSDQNKTVDWVSGKDFVFSYMGANGHALNNMRPVYVSVMEAGYIHAEPGSEGVRNAIARARLLTDVTWTPLKNMPGVSAETGEYLYKEFKAGETYTGIPYSGVIDTDTYVGLNVSLDSFVTALQNENSVLYTENLFSESYPKKATYFGTVCSKFAQYVLDVPGAYNTANVPNIEGMDTVAMPGAYTAMDVQLGDVVVDTSYHTAVCTDLLYNSMGELVYVEISEAISPTARRLLWTLEEFAEEFANYRLCRYQYIDSVAPAYSEYVDPEGGIWNEEKALMPRYGDKYNYTVSDEKGIVDVLDLQYRNPSNEPGALMPGQTYTKATVLRDGEVIDEINLTALEGSTIEFDRSVPGFVEIYLDEGNYSYERTTLYVVDSSIEVTDASGYLSGKLDVTFEGTSGWPVYVQIGTVSDSVYCALDGSETTTSATITFNPARVHAQQVRVAYDNGNGIYLSDWVKFDIYEGEGTGENPSTDPLLSQGIYWEGHNITPSDPKPVMQENKVGYWTYTMVPVKENTTYYSEGATRMWFLDENGEPISTYNAYTDSEVPFQFTTPEGTAYVSIAYSPDLVEQGTETLSVPDVGRS